jgi:putative aminopeptidase FrvX
VECLDHVPVGCPLAYADHVASDETRVTAQLDNALSVAVAASLFADGFAGTVLFTCQEEAGRSWRFIHDYFVRTSCNPRRFLVLDTSPFPDAASATRQQVVLRHRDARAEFDRRLADELRGYCENLGISYGFKDEFVENENRRRTADGRRLMSYGTTELGRLAAFSGGLMNGVTVQIPTTGYHTNEETAAIDAVEAARTLLASMLLETAHPEDS